MSNLNHITITQKDQKAGVNHFKLRDYDARLARWTTIDPYNQYHSPYLAMGNNPISKIDPDGGMATGGGYNSDAEMSLKQKIRELQLRSARMYEDGSGLHGVGAHSGGGGGVSGNSSGYNIDGLNVSASMGSNMMGNDAFITNVNTYNGGHLNLFGYSGAGIYKYYEATNGVRTSGVKSMQIRSFREYMFNFVYTLTGISYRNQPIDNFVYSNIEYGYASNLIVPAGGWDMTGLPENDFIKYSVEGTSVWAGTVQTGFDAARKLQPTVSTWIKGAKVLGKTSNVLGVTSIGYDFATGTANSSTIADGLVMAGGAAAIFFGGVALAPWVAGAGVVYGIGSISGGEAWLNRNIDISGYLNIVKPSKP